MAQSNMRLGGQDAMARYFEQVSPSLMNKKSGRLKNMEGKGWQAEAPDIRFSGSGVSTSTASLHGVGNTNIVVNSGAPQGSPDNVTPGCGDDVEPTP
jgi:hypothetical protein